MMSRAEIISLNVGKPQPALHNNKEISTGIFKTPVDTPLYLTQVNLDGDGQADLVHHGGADKAICVYPLEHYTYWEEKLGKRLKYGAFGENITLKGLPETELCIGDTFRFGEAIVQVSQPRQPCYKLSVKHGLPELPLLVEKTGYTGYYLRVLQEGMVDRQDGLVRLTAHPAAFTVAEANRIMHRDKDDLEAIERILEIEELSASWRATFTKRINGVKTDTHERLTGQT
jgi:MOSC domain-containing protein YiiM